MEGDDRLVVLASDLITQSGLAQLQADNPERVVTAGSAEESSDSA